MTLFPDEVALDAEDARRLVAAQTPQWADLPLTVAGAGTDNQMFRLGDELLVRLPRRPGTADDVAKEQTWLPRLGPLLPLEVPAPVFHGRPDERYPFDWSVYRWIEGAEPTADNVTDWADFGGRLAGFVQHLHALDTMGATRTGSLAWYRGKRLHEFAEEGWGTIDRLRARAALGVFDGTDLDLDAVAALWRTALEVDDPVLPDGWLHGDLRAANLLVREGRLVAAIDFGVLGLGNPTAEHAAIWEYPGTARAAYRNRLGLDEATWQRARGWKLFVAVQALDYYWERWPELARDNLVTVHRLLHETD
ncbi:phosphotransferase [Enemella evansiae]|uniref:aminoglycoside phosphotransferase family protein n=1 Tax=Enemella evansiae TaxID=2016499 RepID=UPI000B9776DA|nr:aminoglycoside phosphotransferase family protein [Enemella evansiae]OYN94335.1 phosphotransferase [Enemella evansiae]